MNIFKKFLKISVAMNKKLCRKNRFNKIILNVLFFYSSPKYEKVCY